MDTADLSRKLDALTDLLRDLLVAVETSAKDDARIDARTERMEAALVAHVRDVAPALKAYADHLRTLTKRETDAITTRTIAESRSATERANTTGRLWWIAAIVATNIANVVAVRFLGADAVDFAADVGYHTPMAQDGSDTRE